jgi:hypothetical protein
LCEYCEKRIYFKKRIAQILKDENYEYEDNYDIIKIRKDFQIKALDLKEKLESKDLRVETREIHQSDFSKFKLIIDDLRDYEVALIYFLKIFITRLFF